jgi:hypothetical protein
MRGDDLMSAVDPVKEVAVRLAKILGRRFLMVRQALGTSSSRSGTS